MNILRTLTVAAALYSPSGFSQETRPDADLQVELDTVRAVCSDYVDTLGIAELQAQYEEVSFDKEKTTVEIDELTRWFHEKYNLDIEFMDNEFTSMSGNLMCPFVGNDLMKLAYLQELQKHVMKYPPHVIDKLGIHTVRFAERIHDLAAGDQAAGFIVGGSGYVNLIIVWPFNHEVFHMIDRYLGGLMCSREKIGVEDKRCDKIEKKNAAWGTLDPDDPKLRSNWDEEQAEFARILFNLDDPELTERQYKRLLERKGSRRQVQVVKKWLRRVSDGAWDERFWEDLQAGRIDENYWEQRDIK